MRRSTFIAIVVLFLLLGGATAYQLILANRDREPFPGPAPGTPLPTITATP
ncbi:MAG: hypothetical protein ACRDGW_01215 [Actinomycetota bacterium]